MPQTLTPGESFFGNQSMRAFCPHCRTSAQFRSHGFPAEGQVAVGQRTFARVECSHCQAHSCVEAVSRDPGRQEFTFDRMYPIAEPESLEHAPASIAAAIREAALCLGVNAPTAGALAMRRAIQLIARDRGVTKGALNTEIDALPISPDLREYAHSVRIIANEAAHPNPLEWDTVTVSDLAQLIDLGREFVTQIYANPARVKALRARADEINNKR